jgi:hypothetical protein
MIDEFEMVSRLRDDVPAGAGVSTARQALDAEMCRTIQSRRAVSARRVAITMGVAAAVAAAVTVPVVTSTRSGDGRHPNAIKQPGTSKPTLRSHHGVPTTAIQLVDYATQAASTQPFDPQPNQWEYFKRFSASSSAGVGGMLFGPPDQRVTTRTWIEVDGKHMATIKDGRLDIEPSNIMGQPYGWRSTDYSYLDSLPTDARQLKRVIAAEMGQQRHVGGSMFDAVQALVENVVVSPQLEAELYSVLSTLPDVHYESTATSIAGQKGVGFYEIEQGQVKHEMVIDPKTYAYLGDKYVAIRDYSSVATDGTIHVKKGQVLGWNATVDEGIVDHAGDIPSD